MGELVKNGEERGFTAAFFGRFDADVRADVPELEGECVDDP